MFIKLKSLRRTPDDGRTPDALGDDNNPQQKCCWGVKNPLYKLYDHLYELV